MKPSRIEALSDGVFAIAMTLLVLEIHVPTGNDLAAELIHLWPSYVAYIISVLLIGLIWANHHSMFVHFKKVDRNLQFFNILLLSNIAFLPFPTSVLASTLSSGGDIRIATFFYGFSIFIGGIFFNLIWQYAIRRRSKLVHSDVPLAYMRKAGWRFLLGIITYPAMALLGLVLPYAAIIGYLILIVYFWLPPKDEAQVLHTRL